MERPERVPHGQRITEVMPVLNYGKVQRIDPEKWRFKITGRVNRKIELTLDEFMSLPRSRVTSDIYCVTGWSKLDDVWESVLTDEIRKLRGKRPHTRSVMVHSVGGFTANLGVEDFFQPNAIFALRHNGEKLTPEHGYPVRLVVPRPYFWKSAK